MWLLLVLLLLLLLIYWESTRELPSCSTWKELFYCLDLNHNHIHWVRSAILSIIVSLLIIFLLSAVSLLNFLLVFLVVFVASYFSANWLSAHYMRNVDYGLEPYLEKLHWRFLKA